MPSQFTGAKWVRARILASADLTDIKGIEDGRVLNPVKAISMYEDIVEVEEAGQRKTLFGRIQLPDPVANLCDDFNLVPEATLLRFATDPTPEDDKDLLATTCAMGSFTTTVPASGRRAEWFRSYWNPVKRSSFSLATSATSCSGLGMMIRD